VVSDAARVRAVADVVLELGEQCTVEAVALLAVPGIPGDPAVFDDLTSNVRAFEQVIQQKQSAAAASNDSATWTKINETGAAPIADKVSASL
jgi:hypothetical protein